ncbi:MAG: UvrD-helicase domain-containing protein [Bacteroidales bacterium]|jgi:DNA helicase-2/ATP-dependent DNA helicase PcrA|nr:UvrD-helicase domain-containing protein [Bacteroidales bacterium]
MSDFLKQLNKEQKEAVIQCEGPMMVIAGAGSGKTRVLTYKIAYLLDQGVDPFNILALTFTNKAAREMKERVIRLIGDTEGKNVWMGTFHSIFAKILRIDGHRLGYPSNFTIYDSDDSKRLIRQIINEKKLDPKLYSPSFISHRISMAKSSLINAEEYANNPEIVSADESARKPLIKDIYKSYTARLQRADAMDFDDLLFNTYILFRDFADVLYKYQLKFKHILVDEYQDTNHAQYLIIQKLAANTENICVVGDDAQSIYGFRGANIANILNFKHDYPDFKLFKLEQNYRSTKNIVEAANHIIAINKDQIQKTVWTENDSGNKIGFIRATSDNEEGQLVANAIFEQKMNNQLPNSSFAVLYRTNAQSRSIEEALRKKNIPYRIYGGLSFYHRKEIKDLLGYFRLTINQNDEDALQRIINFPARGIGKTSIEKMVVAADENNVNLWEIITNLINYKVEVNSGIIRKVGEFATMIKSFKAGLKKKDAYEAAKHIAVSSGLLKLYREEDTPEGISRVENIEELLNAIKEFAEAGAENNVGDLASQGTLEEFMQDVALLTDADNDEEDNDKVSLMTIHAAKGLEFPHVFIVGLEENLFPSIQSISTRTDLEEERRLFYVAITRAMQKVTLSHAESRYRWGQFTITEPSRFLEEIDETLLDRPKKISIPTIFQKTKTVTQERPGFTAVNRTSTKGDDIQFDASDTAALQTGMQVEHPNFGMGKVMAVEGNGANMKATVYFNGVGKKNLLLRFAKLKIIT